MRKALTALAIAAAVCVLAGPALAPALAQEYPPSGENLTANDTRVVPGQKMTVSGGGADPSAKVQIIFASTPRVVATTTADGNGDYSATFTVPDVASGVHTVTAVSEGTVLDSLTVCVNTCATSGASANDLPFTGSSTLPGIGIGVALIGVGTMVLMAARRRRSQREHEPVS